MRQIDMNCKLINILGSVESGSSSADESSVFSSAPSTESPSNESSSAESSSNSIPISGNFRNNVSVS